MAKHVCNELDLRTSVKRPHNADEGIRNPTDSHSLSKVTRSKRPRDATVTAMLQPLQADANNSYVVTRSEMMAFFSLLGTLKMWFISRSVA